MSHRSVCCWALALVFAVLGDAVVACPGSDEQALALLARHAEFVSRHRYRGWITVRRGAQEYGVAAHAEPSPAATLPEAPPGRTLLAAAPEDCRLSEHYQVRLMQPTVSIAGREAQPVVLAPRDTFRHGHVLELDRDTGLVLGATTLAAGSRVLEAFRFTAVELESATAPTTEPAEGMAPRGVFPPWRVDWLPPGFVTISDAPASSHRRSYTDGVVAFSVYLEPLDATLRPGEGLVREGSTLAYTRGRDLGVRSVLVSVVGEVPVTTARMVADSVTLELAHAD